MLSIQKRIPTFLAFTCVICSSPCSLAVCGVGWGARGSHVPVLGKLNGHAAHRSAAAVDQDTAARRQPNVLQTLAGMGQVSRS